MESIEELVLQIFPRRDPARAVVYSGDQEYIRDIVLDLSRRLEEPRDGFDAGAGAQAADLLTLMREDEGADDE